LGGSFLGLYEQSLRAANRFETTIYKSRLAAEQVIQFLDGAGMPTTARGVRQEHVKAFLEDFLSRNKASTTAMAEGERWTRRPGSRRRRINLDTYRPRACSLRARGDA
jgi:hypothetical protein